MRAVRPLANINAEIAQLEALFAQQPVQSVSVDGISVMNPLRADMRQELDTLYEQQRAAMLIGQSGSNGQQTNSRWERGRVSGVGSI